MEPKRQTVAIDVMGGDRGLPSMIDGIARAIQLFGDQIEDLILVGDEPQISKLIASKRLIFSSRHIEILPTTEEISMDDKPMFALRHKKSASMFAAIDLLKNKQVDGVLSCGNTACLVAGGTLKLRMMPGVDRPALATVIPNPSHPFVLIDVGANPSTSAKSFVHNAVLGTQYYNTAINNMECPRVGLLTIGTEEGKGSDVVKEAHELLKRVNGRINYCGLIEGFQLFEGSVDVVVCDGFVGNILLKTIESLAKTFQKVLKKELVKSPLRLLGAVLASGAFRALKASITPDKFSGAPLLGLNGIVVKSHGSSSSEAIAHALVLTFKLAKLSHQNSFSDAIEKINSHLESK